MRVTEQLLRKNTKKEVQKKRFQEEEEETLTYKPYPVNLHSLNQQPGIFSKEETSFHTQESIFDRTALFRTDKKTE